MAFNMEDLIQEIVGTASSIDGADSTIALAVKTDPVTDNIVLVGRSSKTSILCTSVLTRKEVEDNTVDVRAFVLNVVRTLAAAEYRPRPPVAKDDPYMRSTRRTGAIVGFPD